MRFRQVHLDFHTSEKIEDIGKKFKKEAFQAALRKGHVDSITLFSKCHHGWSYHPTKANQMHPNLNFDLFGEQIKAAQEIGVNVVGYISAGLDEKYAVQHPEALSRCKNEQIHGVRDFLTPGYHIICFNSPYLQLLADQVREMCANYDIKGVFLDIASPIKCYCRNCAAGMREQGLDITNEDDVQLMAERTYAKYTRAMREAVDSIKPGLPIFHNGGATPRGQRAMAQMNSHIEIESLPTGGWGYDNLPMVSRYVQPLGMEFLGMTGKFHGAWGEFGGYKHENALIYETSLAVANGGKCSIGDQLHPLGKMDDETYRLIGAAYALIEKKEPWLDNVHSIADVGLLSYDAWLVRHPEEKAKDENYKRSDIGALRILMEGNYLFDVVDEESDFTRYKVLLLPDNIRVDAPLKQKLDAYVAAGGKLIASGKSALSMDLEDPNCNFVYDLGASYCGTREIVPAYITPASDLSDINAAGYVVYSPSECANLSRGGKELATVHAPYFSRTVEHFCSHQHAPEKLEYSGVGVSEGKDGIYIADAIFREYANVGSLIAKLLVTAAIDRLLGDDKTLTVDLPAQGNVTLMDQSSESRMILHLLYAPRIVKGEKKTEVIEDCIPLYNLPVSLKIIEKKPKRVYIAPTGEELNFAVGGDGSIGFEVPKVQIHTMIVIDY